MQRDLAKVKIGTDKIATKNEWIISTLRVLNAQDPQNIGLDESHFSILEKQLIIDPNLEMTPY
jgi:hypothetical protein